MFHQIFLVPSLTNYLTPLWLAFYHPLKSYLFSSSCFVYLLSPGRVFFLMELSVFIYFVVLRKCFHHLLFTEENYSSF